MTIGPKRWREVLGEDRGTSLIELLVGMMVMVVFMTIFTGAVITMARTTTKAEAVTTSAAQVDNAFLELDTVVRYATAVTTSEKMANGTWYVELARIDVAGVETCTQLRTNLEGPQPRLQLRTWTVTTPTSAASLSEWTTIASGLANATVAAGSADQPFVNPEPLGRLQQLTVTIVSGPPEAGSTSTTRASVTFTALNSNSTGSTRNATRCKQVARL